MTLNLVNNYRISICGERWPDHKAGRASCLRVGSFLWSILPCRIVSLEFILSGVEVAMEKESRKKVKFLIDKKIAYPLWRGGLSNNVYL
jgi:hypothetical protein